jgi:hypothetical protein
MRSTSLGGALLALAKKNKLTIKKAVFTDLNGETTVLKLLIIVILTSLSIGSMAQYHDAFREKPPPAIYLAYQPTDHGLGIRGDYHIHYLVGVYGSASYGEWRLYKWSGLGQHVKLTTGILIPYKDWMGNQHDFSLGLNYHWISGEVVESEIYKDDPQFHNPWSFEIGLTIKMKRFALGMRTDILRWEPCIDVGIPLDWRKNGFNHKRRK